MSLVKKVAEMYQKNVCKSLSKYGLRYEDVIMTEHDDYQHALKYMPAEDYENRTRRLRRAMEISAKHEMLPKEIQDIQTPRKFYMADLMEESAKLRKEKDEIY